MAFDDDDLFLPTRTGPAQGGATERKMLDKARVTDALRVVQSNTNGSTTRLEMNRAAPEFITDEVGGEPLPGYCFQGLPVSQTEMYGPKVAHLAHVTDGTVGKVDRADQRVKRFDGFKYVCLGNTDWFDGRTGEAQFTKKVVTWRGTNAHGQMAGTVYPNTYNLHPTYYTNTPNSETLPSGRFPLTYGVMPDDNYGTSAFTQKIYIDGEFYANAPSGRRLVSCGLRNVDGASVLYALTSNPLSQSTYFVGLNGDYYFVVNSLACHSYVGGAWQLAWQIDGFNKAFVQAPMFNSSATKAAGIYSTSGNAIEISGQTQFRDFVFEIDIASGTVSEIESAARGTFGAGSGGGYRVLGVNYIGDLRVDLRYHRDIEWYEPGGQYWYAYTRTKYVFNGRQRKKVVTQRFDGMIGQIIDTQGPGGKTGLADPEAWDLRHGFFVGPLEVTPFTHPYYNWISAIPYGSLDVAEVFPEPYAADAWEGIGDGYTYQTYNTARVRPRYAAVHPSGKIAVYSAIGEAYHRLGRVKLSDTGSTDTDLAPKIHAKGAYNTLINHIFYRRRPK